MNHPEQPKEENEYMAFVYGTLKQGFSGHRLLEGTTFVGKATTVDKYLLTSNRYPLLSESQQLCRVRRECYKISEKVLVRLDKYEGVPHYYSRDSIKVEIDDTKEVHDVFTYFCENELGLTVHEDGHYIGSK